MKRKLIGLEIDGKRKDVEVYVVPKWYEGIGLMFKRREKARALLFEFKRPVRIAIHSFFVFFPFFAIWLNNKNEVIDIKKIKPFEFRILPSRKFVKLVEVPINKKYGFLEFPTRERKV